MTEMKDTFVVIELGGSQHIVSEGDELTVNRIEGNIGDTITIEDVLLHKDEKNTEVGDPTVNYTVTAEILSHERGKKMTIRTFKAKARYRRRIGHRQELTKLKIAKIAKASGSTAKKAPKKNVPAKKTPAKTTQKASAAKK